MHYDVRVSPDWRGEVGVERDIEGIVVSPHSRVHTRTEVEGKLWRERKRENHYYKLITSE